MAPLRRAALGLALMIGSPTNAMGGPAPTPRVADWRPYSLQASLRFGVPIEWIERVMRAESDGQTTLDGHPVRSRAGAIGLMQLMPATWQAMHRVLALGNDPDDSRDNILAGTYYLRLLYDRFGYPGLFAAYNAGPERYADHVITGRRLPAETIAYLAKVGGIAEAPSLPSAPRRETMFAIRYPATAQGVPAPLPPPSLFVVRHDGF